MRTVQVPDVYVCVRMCTCVRTCVRYVWYVYVHVYVRQVCVVCVCTCVLCQVPDVYMCMYMRTCARYPGVYMCVCTCVRVPSVVRGMDDLEGQLVRVISAPVWYVVPGLPVIYLDYLDYLVVQLVGTHGQCASVPVWYMVRCSVVTRDQCASVTRDQCASVARCTWIMWHVVPG